MKRQMIFGTMLSMALAVGLSAQTPPSQPPAGGSQPPTTSPSTPSTPGAQSQAEKTVTLTGCIQAGSGGASSAPGAGAPTTGAPAGSSAQSGQRGGFMLTDVSAGSSSTPGTAGTTGSAATASSYRLTGSENLQQHVGKRVEVTGTVTGRSGSSSTGAGAGAGAGAGTGAGASDMQTLRVTSVKPATGECK